MGIKYAQNSARLPVFPKDYISNLNICQSAPSSWSRNLRVQVKQFPESPAR